MIHQHDERVEEINKIIERCKAAMERLEVIGDVNLAYREGYKDGYQCGLGFALASMNVRVQ